MFLNPYLKKISRATYRGDLGVSRGDDRPKYGVRIGLYSINDLLRSFGQNPETGGNKSFYIPVRSVPVPRPRRIRPRNNPDPPRNLDPPNSR